VRCGRCGTEILAGKRFCHACGEPVGEACPRCRAPIRAEFRFCPDCGLDLSARGDAAGPAASADSAGAAAVASPEAVSADAPGDARGALGRGGGTSAAASPDEGFAVGPGRLERLTRQIPASLAEKIRVTAGASTGERKRATVMFCDLVGSTAIAAGLDPEEYRDLLDQYLEICFREIYRYEGIVNQLAGDGMMALFGAPIAHEDAPERAVRAALAIRDGLAQFSARELVGRGFELRPRLGINTGTVVVGAVGNDLKMDYTAIGDTTNLAARLEGLAAPEAILVSEATARLIRDRFELRPRPPIAVKGKDRPVVAFEVVGALELDGPMAGPRSRGLTRLVAREEELNQLLACFDRLAGHLPQTVAVVGEAGGGKSRLLFEFKERLAGRAVSILEARGSSLSQMLPHAPWIAMVRQAFGVAAGDSTETAVAKMRHALADVDDDPADLAEKLSIFFRTTGGIAEDASDEIKQKTFHAMGRLMAGLCRRQPLLMVFEDLHWIDDLSREALEMAVAEQHAWPMMILVTYRPEYEPRWRSRAASTRLFLRPLESPAAVELVRAVAGGDLPTELEERIVGKADGNPLLLEEITRGLVEEGYLRKLDERIELTRPVADIRIPETVQELIGARLDRLGPQGKRVAQVAAVLGRQFRRDQLVALLAGEPIDVPVQLEELERRGLLHRKTALSEDEYRFGESVTQELAYASLLVRERRQLHQRIAGLIEAEPGEMTAEKSALLAHHYSLSEDRHRAVAALLRAARDAEALPSYGSAQRLYRQAWEIGTLDLGEHASRDDQRRALAAAVGLCRIVMLYGADDDARDLLEVAHRGWELAEALDDAAARAMLSLYEGLFEMSGSGARFAHGLALVERGAEIARAAGLKRVELNIVRGLAWSCMFDGRFEDAFVHVTDVVRELEAIDPPEQPSDLQFGAWYMRASMLLHPGRFDEALVGLVDINARARERGNRTLRSASAASLAQLHFQRGEYAEAARWAEEGLEIGGEIGNPGAVRPSAVVALGVRLELAQGVNPAHYLERIEQGLASAGLLPLYVRLAVEVLVAVGELKTAERCLEVSELHSGGRLRELLNLSARGEFLLHLGSRHWREAERALERAVALAREVEARPALAAALVTAGELALATGDRARGEACLHEAVEIGAALRLGRYLDRAERLLAESPGSAAGALAVG
jgi:class 3 adenylate cyclase/tetratricopeptide (TPR) repeat protein